MIRLVFLISVGFFLGFKFHEWTSRGQCAAGNGKWDGRICLVSGKTK